MGEVEERESERGRRERDGGFWQPWNLPGLVGKSCGGRTVARVDGWDREPRLDGRPGYYGLDAAGSRVEREEVVASLHVGRRGIHVSRLGDTPARRQQRGAVVSCDPFVAG